MGDLSREKLFIAMGVVGTPRKSRGKSRAVTTPMWTSGYLLCGNSLGMEPWGPV